MQIQADFCYSNLQIHHLHEQELEQDERFEWMFPRCRLTPKMLISIPGFKVDWTLPDISPSTCLGALAKPVQVHKLLLLLLFSSPESARLRFCPSELPADMLKHQHPAALLISHSGLLTQRAPFSSASPVLVLQLHPTRQPTSLAQQSQVQVSSHPPNSYQKILGFFP